MTFDLLRCPDGAARILAQQRALEVAGHNVTNAAPPGFTRQNRHASGRHPVPDRQRPRRRRRHRLFVPAGARQLHRHPAPGADDEVGVCAGTAGRPAADQRRAQRAPARTASTRSSRTSPEACRTWPMRPPTPRRARPCPEHDRADDGHPGPRHTDRRRHQPDRSAATTTLDQINSIGDSIAKLNAAIVQSKAVGDAPNDLLDQRDTYLDQLGSLVNVSWTEQATGAVDVTVGGGALVTGSTAATLAESSLTSLTSGKLAALVQAARHDAARLPVEPQHRRQVRSPTR